MHLAYAGKRTIIIVIIMIVATSDAVVLVNLQAGQWSQTLQSAVTNLIQRYGITVVVATGNSKIDACTITPANVNGTIAVAGSDTSNKFDPAEPGDQEMIYEYDNTGKCVDVFAPGVDIMAACGSAGMTSLSKLTLLAAVVAWQCQGYTITASQASCIRLFLCRLPAFHVRHQLC